MHPSPVLVIGATGRIGRLVVHELVRDGVRVRALSRRPADAHLPPGVEIVRGDLTDPESLLPSLQDVRSVFLIWTVSPATVDAIGRRIIFEEIAPEEFRHDTAGIWPPMVVDMLLSAWRATMGHPAYLTTAVQDILGRPARSFHQWALDHADAFLPPPTH